MTNYTPGPWSYGLFNAHDSALKIAAPSSENRMFVAEVFYRREKPLLDYTTDERRQMAREQEANARLIAAAPEILEMLRSWLEFHHGEDATPGLGSMLKDTRAIVTKAEMGYDLR
jgi:hypothetical protein